MKVLSVRVPEAHYHLVERACLDAGLSRTDWLRKVIAQTVAELPPAPAPEAAAVQFCRHPVTKRLGALCIACGAQVGLAVATTVP